MTLRRKDVKWALITGASGGIGYELAKIFAAEGINVVLVARTREKLDTLASELHTVETKVIAIDLVEQSASRTIFEFTQIESIQIDYLINNAGFGIRDSFFATETDQILEMIELNISALTHLTRLFLPEMIQRKSGKILNVASTAAFQPGPWMAVYYATKAYVLSLSEALAHELRGTGVTITTLCPGPTRTGFQERAGAQNIQLMKSKMMAVMDARTVAKAGYDAMMRGKKVIIPGVFNQILALGSKVSPKSISTAIAGNMNKNKS